MNDDEGQSKNNQRDKKGEKQQNLFSSFYWGTIIILAAVTLGLVAVGVLGSNHSAGDLSEEPQVEEETEDPQVVIEPNKFQKMVERAARTARAETSDEIDPLLDKLYKPVYGGISSYADFHYTVLGEYTELVGAALGTATEAVENRLYDGFNERFERVATTLHVRFADEFQNAPMQEIQSEIPSEQSNAPLAPLTQRAIEDALARVRVTGPLGTAIATIGGAATIRAVSAAIAAKVATKVAAKAAGKGVAKGTGILGGAGLGALAGSWAGPFGAAVGGAVGGAASWFAVDAAVITIDQYFNRADFEEGLRVMVDEHRSAIRGHLISAVEQKSEDMENYTLQELSSE